MTKIAVDTAKYDAASRVFGTDLAAAVKRASSTLAGALSGTAGMGGSDIQGAHWGGQYNTIAKSTVQAIDDAGRAAITIGGLLEQTGFNHARADAHSDVSGNTALPPDRTTYEPGAAAPILVPSAAGGEVDPPFGWNLVQEWCQGVFWPDGSPDKLRTAGKAWKHASSTLIDAADLADDGVVTIRSQDSPEVEDASKVCKSLSNGLKEIALQCRNIADSCENQADAIEKAHQDLIHKAIEAVAISTVIQGLGAAFAPITLGVDETVAQPLQAVEIANLSSRITAILDVLTTATRVAVGMLEDALAPSRPDSGLFSVKYRSSATAALRAKHSKPQPSKRGPKAPWCAEANLMSSSGITSTTGSPRSTDGKEVSRRVLNRSISTRRHINQSHG